MGNKKKREKKKKRKRGKDKLFFGNYWVFYGFFIC